MALGAGTLTNEAGRSPQDPTFIESFSMPGDSSYTTGGSAGFASVVQTLFPLRSFPTASIVSARGIGVGYILEFLPATGLLKAFVMSTGAEVANAVDLSTVTFQVTVIAK